MNDSRIRQATLSQWWNASVSFSSSATVKPVDSRGRRHGWVEKKRTEFSSYKRSQLPSGKRLRNYGKSPCYCSCVNPLFRLGHVIFVSSQFKNTSWILPILSTQKSRKLPPKINQHRSSHLTFTGSISCKETNQGKGMVAVMSLKTCHFLRSMGWSNLTRYPGKI